MNTPKWAQDLAINALVYLESKGHNIEVPPIRWRRSKYYKSSSGVCYQHHHITITAGKDRRDAKLVLLHELAHWVLPDREHHGNMFWRTVFDLYHWAKLPPRVCLNREASINRRSKKRLTKLSKEVDSM
jgi:predicted metal-dependent hydrolase